MKTIILKTVFIYLYSVNPISKLKHQCQERKSNWGITGSRAQEAAAEPVFRHTPAHSELSCLHTGKCGHKPSGWAALNSLVFLNQFQPTLLYITWRLKQSRPFSSRTARSCQLPEVMCQDHHIPRGFIHLHHHHSLNPWCTLCRSELPPDCNPNQSQINVPAFALVQVDFNSWLAVEFNNSWEMRGEHQAFSWSL